MTSFLQLKRRVNYLLLRSSQTRFDVYEYGVLQENFEKAREGLNKIFFSLTEISEDVCPVSIALFTQNEPLKCLRLSAEKTATASGR